ncbi:MAG TPA: hypothetical protein VM899_00915, partial [Rubellimicrobium sp.]|nr:hypothetical protein [Rubellimicrobium sp.]
MPEILDIGRDDSVSEYLNNVKWVCICVLLLLVYWQGRLPTALSFAFVFALVSADDIFHLHETGGEWLVDLLGIESTLGLWGQDFGELLVWAGLGVVAVSAIALGYLAADPKGRRLGNVLLAFLGALVLCAVVVDMVHSAFSASYWPNLIFEVLEDGGEMVVGSTLLARCLALLQPLGRAATLPR